MNFPSFFLSVVRFFSTSLILTCLLYSYKLLSELGTDNVNPINVCEKLNNIKAPEYIGHCILFITLFLQGWWGTGILNFPFLFYNFAQWYPKKYFLESTEIFAALSEVMWGIKIKSRFFILVLLYNLWEWISWSPPEYKDIPTKYDRIMRSYDWDYQEDIYEPINFLRIR